MSSSRGDSATTAIVRPRPTTKTPTRPHSHQRCSGASGGAPDSGDASRRGGGRRRDRRGNRGPAAAGARPTIPLARRPWDSRAIELRDQLVELADQRRHLGNVRRVGRDQDELLVGGPRLAQIAQPPLALPDVDEEARQRSGVVARLVLGEGLGVHPGPEVRLGVLEGAARLRPPRTARRTPGRAPRAATSNTATTNDVEPSHRCHRLRCPHRERIDRKAPGDAIASARPLEPLVCLTAARLAGAVSAAGAAASSGGTAGAAARSGAGTGGTGIGRRLGTTAAAAVAAGVWRSSGRPRRARRRADARRQSDRRTASTIRLRVEGPEDSPEGPIDLAMRRPDAICVGRLATAIGPGLQLAEIRWAGVPRSTPRR